MKHVVANLKMQLVLKEDCDRYLSEFKRVWKGGKPKGATVTVCPSSLFLERFSKALPKGVFLGAQDLFFETKGSFTGEISPLSLRDIGVTRVIIGHSERRQYAMETDETVGKKVLRALESNLQPLVCVGETREERDSGQILQVIRRQVEHALEHVSSDKVESIMLAYEPRWAIGSDRTPSSHEIMEMRVLLKKILTEKYGEKKAEEVALLYGGSVRADLIRSVCIDPGMDGVLVGRESLIAEELMHMVSALDAVS